MNLPDNLLTSCTSIEKFNLPYSHIGKNILYQNRDSNIPNTHIMCLSWIMGDGQMEYIYSILMNFPDNLLTSWTYIEQVNLTSSHIGKMLNQHRDSDITNTHITWLSLNHGWGTDEYYLSDFVNLPDNLLMNYTAIEQVNLPWSRFRKDSLKNL
jgi:hypothetical protein